MEPKEKHRDQSKVLVLLLFVGAAVLAISSLESSTTPKAKQGHAVPARLKTDESSVNSHLMFTNDKIEFQRKSIEVENARALNEAFKRKFEQSAYVNPNKLDLSSEDHAAIIAEVLGRGEKKQDIQTPEDIVQQEIYMAEQAAEYNQAYREEYARQFVENARKGGYKIILSEDLSKVISVTPIRKPGKDAFDIHSDGLAPIR